MSTAVRLYLLRVAALFESALLLGFGAFICVLAASPLYVRFMHPFYTWLSMAGGVLLVCYACALLLAALRGGYTPHLARMLCFGALLACAALALPKTPGIPQAFTADLSTDAPATFSGAENPAGPGPAPRVTLNGQTYVRMNTAEFVMAADQQTGDNEPLPKYVALRGILVPLNEHYALVTRMMLWCCLADGVQMGVVITLPPDADAQALAGRWVSVAGTTTPTPDNLPPLPEQLGTAVAVQSPTTILTTHQLHTTAPPNAPAIFEYRTTEPYAY